MKIISVTRAVGFAVTAGLLSAGALSATPPSQSVEIRAAMAWLEPPEPPPGTRVVPPDDRILLHIPGSAQAYTRAQTMSLYVAPDWWPQDHPPMPQIVAHGRGKAWPCGHCHLPTGLGRSPDAATAGLPFGYIIEQIRAFCDGERKSPIMHEEVSHLGAADLKLAAAYFSSLRFTPWTKVIETATVPKMHGENWMWAPTAGAGREALGDRIIVTPVNPERTKLGDTRSGYIAYVPPGSIHRGASIAAKGIGAAQACESCHGADLRGVGMIPPLAGRMPNYIVHELILFRIGQRNNVEAVPMRLEASQLSVGDMIDVAAYAASRKP